MQKFFITGRALAGDLFFFAICFHKSLIRSAGSTSTRQRSKPAQLIQMTIGLTELTITEGISRGTGVRELFRLQCCCSVLHSYPLLHVRQEGSPARKQYNIIFPLYKKQNTAVFQRSPLLRPKSCQDN